MKIGDVANLIPCIFDGAIDDAPAQAEGEEQLPERIAEPASSWQQPPQQERLFQVLFGPAL